MQQNSIIDRLLRLCAVLSRTLLGLVFIFSGFVKAVDPLGTTYKIEDYLKAFGGFFDTFVPLAEPVAWLLIAFEFVLGVCLLCNVKTCWTAWLSLAFMCVMTPLTLYIALTDPVSDCGCFGDALVISNWATFWKNILLLALVILLLLTKKRVSSLPRKAGLAVACVAVGLAFGMMLYARMHLPVLDFRPYKVGNSIPELMDYPEDAEPDQYETLLIYEKDGRRTEFTLQDYPRGDSSWTFVDQRTTLVKKGYEPPIHDFEIITLDGDDLTDDVLSAPHATLVVMYDLAKTDSKHLSRLSALLRSAEESGEPCWLLTGSGEDDVEDFCRRYDLPEESFCFTDPVTLKTIVRANPGVLVLEQGVVVDKYNLRNRK